MTTPNSLRSDASFSRLQSRSIHANNVSAATARFNTLIVEGKSVFGGTGPTGATGVTGVTGNSRGTSGTCESRASSVS